MAAALESGWYRNESGNRLFAVAVLCSLVLHAALLVLLPVLRDARKEPPTLKTLTARLAAPGPPEPVVQRIEPPLQPQTRPQRPAPAPKVAPPPLPVSPAAMPAPVLSVEPAKQSVESAPAVRAAPAPPPPAASIAKTSSQSAAPAATAQEAATLAQYRLEIMDLARRYKKYPRVAQDNNWVGTSEVRMVIGPDGAIASLLVKTSAGYAVLDQEALAMIRTAKSKATVPPALRGRVITLEVPVIFNLKEEGG